MKKHKLKIILGLMLFFSLFSCTEDLEHQQEELHSHEKYSITNLSYKQASKISEFKKVDDVVKNKLNLKIGNLKSFKSAKLTRNSARESDLSLAVDSTLIKEVSTVNFTSYTMLVVLDSVDYSNGSFDNLVIQTDNNQKTEAYIIHYIPSSDAVYNLEHDTYSFNGTMSTNKVYGTISFHGNSNIGGGTDNDNGGSDGSGGTTGNNNNTSSSVTCTTLILCDWAYTHMAGPGCQNTYSHTVCSSNPSYNPWTSYGYASGNEGDPVGNGTSGPGGSGNGSGGGGGSTGSDSSNTSNPVLTSPVLPDEIENINDDPCENLKNNTTSSAAYKQKFKDLTSNYNLPHETGFVEKDVNGTNQYVDMVPNGVNGVTPPPGSKNATHVHQNLPKTSPDGIAYDGRVKIHSVEDLESLIGSLQRNNSTTPEDAFVLMLSSEAIYAITILEPFTLSPLQEQNMIDFKNDYKRESDRIIKSFYSESDRKNFLQKMFLKGLKDVGIENKVGFFEGEIENENATDINNYNIKWTKKTLKKVFLGYKVEPTPCN